MPHMRRTLRNPRNTPRKNAEPQRGTLRPTSSAAFQALGFLAGSPRPPPALGGLRPGLSIGVGGLGFPRPPPSEPYVRFSRIRLASQWGPQWD